jgi:hypothetical protein
LNSTSQAATWIFDPALSDSWVVNAPGVLRADGLWTTPPTPTFSWVTLEAHSQDDPLRFGRTKAMVLDLDADEDLEQDALDLAVVIMEWQLYPYWEPYHGARILGGDHVSDFDIAAFNEAFVNAWSAE